MKVALKFSRWLASISIVVWFSFVRRITEANYRSLDGQAKRIVEQSLRDNVRRRSATPGYFARLLLWGGEFPLFFSASLGGICAAVAAPFFPALDAKYAVITLPALRPDYNHWSFFGPVWSVQATLVALVYPFVLTFIAVMLQRRAASKIALSVYLLHSAVVPGGTSSLMLLAAMSIQYFLLAAAPSYYFVSAAVFNGLWFLANLTITGFFLAKTIRYVEDEVGELAYRNLAVSQVLKDELVTSVSKHLLGSAAERLGWHPLDAKSGDGKPIVQFFPLSGGTCQATKYLSRENALVGVHLGALDWVAKRWLARVPPSVKLQNGRTLRPRLHFRGMLHGTSVGSVELCSIVDGPGLTPVEVEVVRRAFVFGERHSSLVAGNTGDMLEELATEVESLSEQGRHTASEQVFDRLIHLHIGLLEACHEAVEGEGDVSSAVGLETFPYSWGGRNLNTTWLMSYRELIFVAVAQIERDQTLLTSLAYSAARLVAESELKTPIHIAELFQLPRWLDDAMAKWWLKEAQCSGATAGTDGFTLPLPAGADYRRAVVTLVGGLSSFRYAHAEHAAKPVVAWKARCRAAKSWAAHVDLSATLLLNAVARGDAVAAEWYCDNLAAWWGNHHFELDYGHGVDYQPGLSEVRLEITELDWPAAEKKLSALAQRPVTIEEGQLVVWHAVRRYWESMRLVVCLLLLQQAEARSFQKLATRVAANLARCRLFSPGPSAEGLDLSDADEVLSLFVEICCSDSWVRWRLDEFCAHRDRFRGASVVVSGWMYPGSVGATDVRSKTVALSQLLLATQPSARQIWSKTHDVIERSDIDLHALGQVANLASCCIAEYRTKAFRPHLPVANLLTESFAKSASTSVQRKGVFRGFSRLRRNALARREASWLALSVSQESVDELARRLSAAMATADALTESRAFCTVRVEAAAGAHQLNAPGYTFTKENLTAPPLIAISDEDVSRLARDFLKHTADYALYQMLVSRAPNPVAHPNDPALLLNVESAANAIRMIGMTPVAIVPKGSTASKATRPYQWYGSGRPSLPPGIQLTGRRPGVHGFADSFVNDTPVILAGTPAGQTYVVPLEWMASLVLSPTPFGVVVTSHSVTGTNEVTVNFDWSASLQAS